MSIPTAESLPAAGPAALEDDQHRGGHEHRGPGPDPDPDRQGQGEVGEVSPPSRNRAARMNTAPSPVATVRGRVCRHGEQPEQDATSWNMASTAAAAKFQRNRTAR
jgi:hypothetical protein